MDYEGPPSARELHVRRFLKKLKDNALRSTLQGQIFKSVRDLEKTLKRVKAVQQDDGYTTPPHKARDSKASGVHFSCCPLRRRDQGDRAYVSAEEDSDSEEKLVQPSDSEDKPEVDYLPGTLPPSFGRSASSEKANVARAAGNSVAAARAPTTEEKIRAAERMGGARHGRLECLNPRGEMTQNNSYCENCRVFGHYKANRWQG
ncbi:hypothetical protein PI124_g16557 [Phytophthora idaei]|nr:hypothetical protein PI125_g3805 [Phytophthora idaei]KAG3143085.1 hypothetical protein PI126_g14778 [Phytophthora idaei]KAG3238489.1 hypothetical protein PI124_g16557 [Phytophthora idaei]